MKKQLAAVIFSVFTLLAAKGAPEPGPGFSLTVDRKADTAPGLLSQLEDAARRTARILHLPEAAETGGRLRLVAAGTPQPDGAGYRVTDGTIRLTIDGSERHPLETPGMLRRFLGALIATRCGWPPPADPDWLPTWVFHGLRQRLYAEKAEERFMRGNRSLPSLSALLETGQLPDFRHFFELNPRRFSAAEEFLYAQIARGLLESAVQRRRLTAYLRAAARSDEPAARRQLWPGPGDAAGQTAESGLQSGLTDEIAAVVWNDFTPRPAERSLRDFSELRGRFSLPEFDESGEATGRELFCTLDQLPELLKQRPDAPELRIKLLRNLTGFLRDDSRDLKAESLKFGVLISRLGSDDDAAAAFRERLDAVEAGLRRRAAIEQLLTDTEFECTPAFVYYRYLLLQLQIPDAALTAAVSRLLEDAEQEYIAE